MKRQHWHSISMIGGSEIWSVPFDTKTAADSRAASMKVATRVQKCESPRDESRFGHCTAEREAERHRRRPLWEVVRSLERGEKLPCDNTHREDVQPPAPFYCAQCKALRCASCAIHGFCIVCRAVVRSTGALLLASKETKS